MAPAGSFRRAGRLLLDDPVPVLPRRPAAVRHFKRRGEIAASTLPNMPGGAPLNALPLPEVVSRLAARFGPDLASGWITPYNAAYAVGAALSQERPATAHGASDVSAVEALGALLLVPSAREVLDRLEATLIEAVLDRGVTLGPVGLGVWRPNSSNHAAALPPARWHAFMGTGPFPVVVVGCRR